MRFEVSSRFHACAFDHARLMNLLAAVSPETDDIEGGRLVQRLAPVMGADYQNQRRT
jgi:hypothetical protein